MVKCLIVAVFALAGACWSLHSSVDVKPAIAAVQAADRQKASDDLFVVETCGDNDDPCEWEVER